jgi:hypothetical protein
VKVKFFLLVIMILLVANLSMPGAVSASDTAVQSAETLAQKSAQCWLDATAPQIPDLPQWMDARVTAKQQYHDLKGEINAYLFSITNKDKIVGFVAVGNALYEYTFFEASEVAPPAEPTEAEIKAAIRYLEFDTTEVKVGKPVDFVYTGTGGFYAVYKIGEKNIAINLIQKTATPVADLKYILPSPEEYREMKKILRETEPATRSSGYAVLTLSYYQPGGGWCGPCAGVSIGRYYRDVQGYSSLYNDSNMYSTLYTEMDVVGGITWPAMNFAWGFYVMTLYGGYYNFTYDTDEWVSSGDFWDVVDFINNGWPVGLCIVSDFHWRAIRGYGYLTEMDIYNIYCTDSAALSNYYIIGWSNWCLNARLAKNTD